MALSDTTYEELVAMLKDEVREIAEERAYWYVTGLDIVDCVRVMHGIIKGNDDTLGNLPYVNWSGKMFGHWDWDEVFDGIATAILGEDADDDDAQYIKAILFYEVAQDYGKEVTVGAVRQYCAEILGH